MAHSGRGVKPGTRNAIKDDPKTRQLAVRFTPDEVLALEQEAETLGFLTKSGKPNLSALLRSKCGL